MTAQAEDIFIDAPITDILYTLHLSVIDDDDRDHDLAMGIVSRMSDAQLVATTGWGENALHVAVQGCDAEVVDAICKRMTPEQRMLARGDSGDTALHLAMASRESTPEVVSVLCRHLTKFDLCRTNGAGQTPLQVAGNAGGIADFEKMEVLCGHMTKAQLLISMNDRNCRWHASKELERRNISLTTPFAKALLPQTPNRNLLRRAEEEKREISPIKPPFGRAPMPRR